MTDLRKAAQQALEALEGELWLMLDKPEDEQYRVKYAYLLTVITALRTALEQQAEPVSMRMPKVGDKVICLEDESLGEVVSLTSGGSPDIVFDDGSRGTYLLREFAELFGYAEQRQQQAEPVAHTTGHCENHKQQGGCQLHNLQCGWPDCDRKPISTSLQSRSQQQAEPMTEVADRFAHRMALELECVLSDGAYSNKWYKSAMQVLSEYRSAMNAIHEQHSPTFMGEPRI